MIMSDLWDQISEIADLNKVKHLLSLSRSPGKVGPGGYFYTVSCCENSTQYSLSSEVPPGSF